MLRALSIFTLFAFAPAAQGGGTKFGPEIELRGAKQVPGVFCLGSSWATTQLGLATLVGAAGWKAIEHASNQTHPDEPQSDNANLSFIAPAFFLGAASCTLFYKDEAAGDHYIKKLLGPLQRDAKDGKLELTEFEEGNLKRKALKARYPDGTTIIFGQDPTVIEVKLNPTTSAEMTAKSEFFEREIFGRAEAAGLKIPRFDGPWNGGHVHIDIATAFGNDPKKFLNFVLDFYSHGELAAGLLVKDRFNAAPLDVQKKRETLEEFIEFVYEYIDDGKKLDAFALERIRGAFRSLFNKDSALHINAKFGTLEVRALRSQRSASALAKVMQLLDARIQYTNVKDLVPLPRKNGQELKTSQKAEKFRKYVEDSGLKYEDFRQLVPERFRISDGPQSICMKAFSRLRPRFAP